MMVLPSLPSFWTRLKLPPCFPSTLPAAAPTYLDPLSLGLHEEDDAGVRLVEGVPVKEVLAADAELHLGDTGGRDDPQVGLGRRV